MSEQVFNWVIFSDIEPVQLCLVSRSEAKKQLQNFVKYHGRKVGSAYLTMLPADWNYSWNNEVL